MIHYCSAYCSCSSWSSNLIIIGLIKMINSTKVSCGAASIISAKSPSNPFYKSTSSLWPLSSILALISSGLTFFWVSIHLKNMSRLSTKRRRSHCLARRSKLMTMARISLISSGVGFLGGGSSSLLVLSSLGFHLSSRTTRLKKSRPP